MACFLVPGTEAIIATMVRKAAASEKTKTGKATSSAGRGAAALFVQRLKWLSTLLWGGSALLAFEHVWHGEVTPWFPFLTAASNPADTRAMLHEMSTTGVAMAVLVTLVWVGMVLVTSAMAKKARAASPVSS